MSTNNNPHGHLNPSQAQTPSWNPLQIPSYIPRQPQLAHMSNERPMVRSPLAWHAPPVAAAPPETLYNFMATANHKSLDHQMNPLLPAYVRGSSVFDSMDLSLQSARAPTTTTSSSLLNKTAIVGMPIVQQQLDYGLKVQEQQLQQQQQHHQQSQHPNQLLTNNYPIHNLSNSSPSQMSQQQHHNMQSISSNTLTAPSTQNVVAGHTTRTTTTTSTNNYLNNNGNDCETTTTTTATTMLPPLIGNNTNTGININNNSNSNNNNNNNSNPPSGGPSPVHYNMRDSTDTTALRTNEQQQMFSNKSSDMHRMNFESEYSSKCLQKTEDLVPKFLMSNKMQQQQQVSPKKNSPLRNYHTHHHQQQQQQQQQQKLSPYHNTSNVGIKRNGPHTPPNQSPTMLMTTTTTTGGLPQQQQEIILQGNGSGGDSLQMEFNQMQANHFLQSSKQQQAQSTPSLLTAVTIAATTTTTTTPASNFMATQQQTIYQNAHAPQQQQAQTQIQSKPFGMQLKQEQTSPSSTKLQNTPYMQPTTDSTENIISDLSALKPTPLRNRADTSDSSSSSDDDDDDESMDSSNSNSNSQRSAEKSNEQKTNIRPPSCTESRSKDLNVKDNKDINTPPRPPSNQSNHSVYKEPTLSVKVNSPSASSKSPLNRQNSDESVETNKTLVENGVNKMDSTNKINDNNNDCTTRTTLTDLANNNNNNNNSNNNNNHNNINCEYTRNLLNSPKTKKQRQVLKLRHAENSNSNSNNSIMQNEVISGSSGGGDACGGSRKSSDRVLVATQNDDNAVSADELCKDTTIDATATAAPATTTPSKISNCPLSPNSNSRSSSSSSSSSSCSNSSRSSCDSKSNNKNSSISRLQQSEKEPQTSVQEQQAVGEHISINKITSPKTMLPIEINDNEQKLNNIPTAAATTIITATTSTNANEDLHLHNKKENEESNNRDTQQSSRFEEVENKLEEMFAGIEDEIPQGEIATVCNASQPTDDLNLALQLATRCNTPDLKDLPVEELKMPMPTKAARKSTPPIHINTSKTNNITDIITTTITTTTTTSATTKQISNACTPTNTQTSATLAKLALETTTLNTINTENIPSALQPITKTTSTTNINLKRLRLPRRSSVGIAFSLEDINDNDDKNFDPSIYLKNFNYKPLKNLLPPKQRKIQQQIPPTPQSTSSTQSTVATSIITPIKKSTTPVPTKLEEININNININNTNNTNSNSNVNIIIDDEKPSTSAAALAAMAAATKENEKLMGNNKKKQPMGGKKGKAAAKGKNKGSGKSTKTTAAATITTTTTATITGKQQQQKTNRRGRKNSSDEDDASNSYTRDGTTVTSGGGSAGELKYRSPFILVKGDGSVSVINTPTAEDAINEGKTVARKTQAAKYAHDRKIRGLHSSTLSVKYDAETPDSTWICVFCKQGPHKMGLGDLFGPYLISSDCEEFRMAFRFPGSVNVDALFAAKRRRCDMIKTHPRNLPVVPALQQKTPTTPLISGAAGGRGKKRKKSMTNEIDSTMRIPAITALTSDPLNTSTCPSVEPIDAIKTAQMLLGMTKVAEHSFEVWLHEDCAVWAPDVFLVGARVTGLDSTVWDSTLNQCSLCSKTGATVCCLQRDCKIMAHAPCARNSGWSLDETNMCTHCQRHAIEQLGAKDRQLSIISDTLHYVHSIQSGSYMTDIMKS